MPREIKFRAWDKKEKKMKFEEDGTYFFDSEGCFPDTIISITHNNNGWIWMQYTGLKDKNGKEIYEGDIIHSKWKEDFVGQEDCKQIVYWSNKNGGWAMNEKGKDVKLGNFHLRFHCHPKHIKVIGNIYENKELLK